MRKPLPFRVMSALPAHADNGEGSASLCCPGCGSKMIRVVDSRAAGSNSVRRGRVCRSCHGRWTTYELPAEFLAGLPEVGELERLGLALLQLGELIRTMKKEGS